jgi:magnesium transporter
MINVMEDLIKSPQVIVYLIQNSGLQELKIENQQQLKAQLEQGIPLWIDVIAPDSPQEIQNICEFLGVHPAIAEDIIHLKDQRPKVETIDSYVFWINRVFEMYADNQYRLKKMATVLKKEFVLTFRDDRDDIEQIMFQQIDKNLSKVTAPKTDFFALLLLSLVLDDTYETVDSMTDRLEAIEEILIEQPKKVELNEVYFIKRRILFLRKLVCPIVDITSLLMNEQIEFILPKTRMFITKIHENALRALEILELYQQMISYVFDMYLSSTNALTNKSITLLTQFSTIFIPLTFISGIYGMNFKFMPELDYKYGYPMVWLAMSVVAAATIYYLKKNQQ